MLWISLFFINGASLPPSGVKKAVAIAQIYTPKVAWLAANHTLILEVEASLALFKGPAALCHQLRQALHAQGLRIRLALAPTAQGALWLARQASSCFRRCLKHSTLHYYLNRLPITALPSLAPWHTWLQGIGCWHLGQVRLLPRQGLQQRTAPKLLEQLDAAYGLRGEHYIWEPTPKQFEHTAELDYRLEQAQRLLRPLEHLLQQCCLWLNQYQLACRQLQFLLHHEKGRKAQAPTLLHLRFSQATWLVHEFLPVLKETLNACLLPAPVIAVTLRVTQTENRAAPKTSLFPEPDQWQRNENQLFDLLQARLGENNVLRPKPQADYRPEIANQWAAASTVDIARAQVGSSPVRKTANLNPVAEPLSPWPQRPFWLLPKPQALRAANNRPVYKHQPLTLVQGPERIESGWWDNTHEARDYFIAQDAQGVHYWVFRASPTRTGVADAHWYLQGLFA